MQVFKELLGHKAPEVSLVLAVTTVQLVCQEKLVLRVQEEAKVLRVPTAALVPPALSGPEVSPVPLASTELQAPMVSMGLLDLRATQERKVSWWR